MQRNTVVLGLNLKAFGLYSINWVGPYQSICNAQCSIVSSLLSRIPTPPTWVGSAS